MRALTTLLLVAARSPSMLIESCCVQSLETMRTVEPRRRLATKRYEPVHFATCMCNWQHEVPMPFPCTIGAFSDSMCGDSMGCQFEPTQSGQPVIARLPQFRCLHNASN